MRRQRTTVLLLWVLCALAFLYGISLIGSGARIFGPSASSVASAPLPTPESVRIAAAPQSFQHLVSLTPRGFEPKELTAKKGETIRFVNNTKETATLVGAPPFSQTTLAPRDFAEITFENAGAYPYSEERTRQAAVVHAE